MDSELFARAHRVLAEPKRVEIIEMIRRLDPGGGISCGSVLAESNITQSTFSHHVTELVESGLVNGNKQGRFVLLSVNEAVVTDYIDTLREKMLGL